jgi:hypothetical protein
MTEQMGQALQTDHTSLQCPSCGDPTLHHDAVNVYFRQEDADEGIAVAVDGGAIGSMVKVDAAAGQVPVAVSTSQAGNPSPRRDGVAIRFWCESCAATPVLNIIQHKGDTIVEWGHVN